MVAIKDCLACKSVEILLGILKNVKKKKGNLLNFLNSFLYDVGHYFNE